MVFVLKNMTMVHVAACEAIEGGRDRDQSTWIDTHRIFPAQFVRIECPMSLKADGCCRCSRFWMEAVRVVQVSAQRLVLHEMHMKRMGVFRQIQDTPDLCRPIGHEPVDSILKVTGDGAVAHSCSVFICYRHQRFFRSCICIRHLSKFTERKHAVGILDHRHDAVLMSRGQVVMFEPTIRRGECRGQDEGVIHQLRGDTELHHFRVREPVLRIWRDGWLGCRTVIKRCASGVDQGQPLPLESTKVDEEISTLRRCEQQSIRREVNRLPEQADNSWATGWFLGLFGQIALRQGAIARAHILLEAAMKRHQQLGDQQGQALIYALLAQAAASEHDYMLSRTLAAQSLEIARTVRDTGSLILCLEELADVVAGQGEPEWATVLWGAAEHYREVSNATLPLVERLGRARRIEQVKRLVGERVFAAKWAEGRKMTAEQAIVVPPTHGWTSNAQKPELGKLGRSSAKQPLLDPLSQRELEVLQLLAAGASNQEIATVLVVAPGTIKLHVSHILSKLGVKVGRKQFYARDLGLLPDAPTASWSARTYAIIEAENRRGCTGSFGSSPIQPQTGVHPWSGHTRHSPV